MQIKIED